MAKLESATAVRRTLQRGNVSDIPNEKTIRHIYDKFLETGSVEDRERPGRPSSVTEEKKEEIVEALAKTPMTIIHLKKEEGWVFFE
jgi:transposase